MTTATIVDQRLLERVEILVAPFGEATERHIKLLLEEALCREDAMFFLRLIRSGVRVTCDIAEAWHHTIERFNMSTMTVRALNDLLEPVGLQYLAFCGCGDCIIPLTSKADSSVASMEAALMLHSHTQPTNVSLAEYARYMAPRYARMLEKHGMP